MAAREKKRKRTPVRRALNDDSSLQPNVNDGITALEKSDHQYLAADIRPTFDDSLNLDAALQQDYSNENRWDYLLGHTASQEVIGLEPHSAKEDQVSRVISKRKAARQQLASHLKSGARVSKWLWGASGRVQFVDTEKARRRLDENGIEFVGTQVQAKHLPSQPRQLPTRKKRR